MRRTERILVSPIVIGELIAGFRKGSRERKNREQLERFLRPVRTHLLSITSETSEFYGAILTGLQAKGTPIPTNDIWIAASAMQYGAALATSDGHFSEIDGLLLLELTSDG